MIEPVYAISILSKSSEKNRVLAFGNEVSIVEIILRISLK
jgi:hypothetical protein